MTAAEIQPVPNVMRKSQNEYVEGIAVLDGRMVTLLEMTKLTSSFAIEEILDQAA